MLHLLRLLLALRRAPTVRLLVRLHTAPTLLHLPRGQRFPNRGDARHRARGARPLAGHPRDGRLRLLRHAPRAARGAAQVDPQARHGVHPVLLRRSAWREQVRHPGGLLRRVHRRENGFHAHQLRVARRLGSGHRADGVHGEARMEHSILRCESREVRPRLPDHICLVRVARVAAHARRGWHVQRHRATTCDVRRSDRLPDKVRAIRAHGPRWRPRHTRKLRAL